jgi:hypothetical protein
MRKYAEYFQVFAQQYPDLAAGLEGVSGLGGVMKWMKRREIAIGSVEILNQDEFDLDFLVPLGDGRTLVFGIT